MSSYGPSSSGQQHVYSKWSSMFINYIRFMFLTIFKCSPIVSTLSMLPVWYWWFLFWILTIYQTLDLSLPSACKVQTSPVSRCKGMQELVCVWFGFFSARSTSTTPQKWKLSFQSCLVLLFRIASTLQKQLYMKLQFLAFDLTRINSPLNFIFYLLQPIIFIYCPLSKKKLYLIWGTKFN